MEADASRGAAVATLAAFIVGIALAFFIVDGF